MRLASPTSCTPDLDEGTSGVLVRLLETGGSDDWGLTNRLATVIGWAPAAAQVGSPSPPPSLGARLTEALPLLLLCLRPPSFRELPRRLPRVRHSVTRCLCMLT